MVNDKALRVELEAVREMLAYKSSLGQHLGFVLVSRDLLLRLVESSSFANKKKSK